jgi:L-threonylcarbamoyladenylate synthase
MTAEIIAATPHGIERAAQCLCDGALVAFPTETVYGLGADAGNPDAVRRIFAAKGRPADHPVIVHLASAERVTDWARTLPEGAKKLAAAFWPGALTLIVPRSAHASDLVTGGQDSVGLRVPSHPVALALLAACARRGVAGIAGPSANRFGRISPTTAHHVAADLGSAVALIVDGGACAVGIESTIVAFVDDDPVLLRPGGIGIDDLTRVLGQVPRSTAAAAPRASGTLASHYAPRTPARLVAAADLRQEIARSATTATTKLGVLARSVPRPPGFRGAWIAAAPDPAAYAHDLYAHLRSLDGAGASAILIEAPPADRAWLAVNDRLTRATHDTDRPTDDFD